MGETPPFGNDFLAVEWPLLLECCSPRPDGERIRALLAHKPKWRDLISLAEEHGVIAQLDTALRSAGAENLPAEIQSSLQQRHRAQLMFTLGITAELFRLLERFRAAAAEAILVKGPVLSMRAYGDPGQRQYGDLDFLIRARDLLPATHALNSGGYEGDVPLEAITAGKVPGEYLFMRPGTRLLVDLHTEHTFRYFPRPLPVEDYFARSTEVALDGNKVPALSAEDEFVLICIHGAKHFWERLMWVADVAAMAAGGTKLDWDIVKKSAQAVGAERMVNVALRLVQDLLHTQIPPQIRNSVERDRGAAAICRRIKAWLPFAGFAPPSLPLRALFRVRMCGGLIAGPVYLLRLSFSPTEEDWIEGAETKRSWFWDAMRRPFRLLKKYGQDGRN
ncbi:MAG TPA: nucleotidyltransferase family protein [Candidatus Eremiobacteraceae bacterium]|nr:nucleotidyltransferase family protein [Candidatus Eremiobacteraceae bacterium]